MWNVVPEFLITPKYYLRIGLQRELSAFRPIQLRAPHTLGLGAQDSCTAHSACTQDAPHSPRCSFYRRYFHSSRYFTLFRAFSIFSAVTFP